MTADINQIIERISISLVCLGLPGIFFILDGIRTIRNKKAISIGRSSNFRWRNPVELTGDKAIENGRAKIIFGVALFLIGICLASSLII